MMYGTRVRVLVAAVLPALLIMMACEFGTERKPTPEPAPTATSMPAPAQAPGPTVREARLMLVCLAENDEIQDMADKGSDQLPEWLRDLFARNPVSPKFAVALLPDSAIETLVVERPAVASTLLNLAVAYDCSP